MKKILMSAAVLSAVLSAQAQASLAVGFGFIKAYGESSGPSEGKSVSMIYNQPLKPGTFVNLNASHHQVFNTGVSYPTNITPTEYNLSFDMNVSIMQAIHDNMYVEAGIGTLFNDNELKPMTSLGGGVMILDTRNAKLMIDMKALLTTADHVKAYKGGKPDMLYIGQFRLFMPFDTKPKHEYLLDKYRKSSKPRVSRPKRASVSGDCYSF